MYLKKNILGAPSLVWILYLLFSRSMMTLVGFNETRSDTVIHHHSLTLLNGFQGSNYVVFREHRGLEPETFSMGKDTIH